MTDTKLNPLKDSIALQNDEFDTLTRLAIRWFELRRVPVVDDDYPEFRYRYESAMATFLDAVQANGRIVEGMKAEAPIQRAEKDIILAVLHLDEVFHNMKGQNPSQTEFRDAMAGLRVATREYWLVKGPETPISTSESEENIENRAKEAEIHLKTS